MTDEICPICGKEKFSFAMKTCPMCKRRFCDTCEYRMGGGVFCSKECANLFYFSGEDGFEEE